MKSFTFLHKYFEIRVTLSKVKAKGGKEIIQASARSLLVNRRDIPARKSSCGGECVVEGGFKYTYKAAPTETLVAIERHVKRRMRLDIDKHLREEHS